MDGSRRAYLCRLIARNCSVKYKDILGLMFDEGFANEVDSMVLNGVQVCNQSIFDLTKRIIDERDQQRCKGVRNNFHSASARKVVKSIESALFENQSTAV